MGENGMDYYKIGMRIRAIRRAKRLSQERLAEMVDISVVHMSHIETGNTKMSLAVLVAIAQALDVSTDSILFDGLENIREAFENTPAELAEDILKNGIRLSGGGALLEGLRERLAAL